MLKYIEYVKVPQKKQQQKHTHTQVVFLQASKTQHWCQKWDLSIFITYDRAKEIFCISIFDIYIQFRKFFL